MGKAGILLILTLWVFGAQAQKPLEINRGFYREVLGKEIAVYNDEQGRLSLEEILNKEFIGLESKRPNLGFTAGAIWTKTIVENNSELEKLVLLINQPVLDTVEIFVLNDEEELIFRRIIGEAFPFSYRAVQDRYFIQPFDIPPSAKRIIYTRIATKEQIVLPMYISSNDGVWDIMQKANFLFGAYFGLILVMALYNLFVYLSVRDRSYILYVIYILSVGITQAALEGYTHYYFWPDSFWMASRSVYFFTSLVSITSIIFLRDFLKTKIYSSTLHKISRLIFVYFGMVFIAAIIEITPFVHMAAQIGITLVAVYIFTTSIVVYRKGYSPAKFFLAAWSILIVGIVLYALKDAGIIPSTPLTNYAMQFGSAIEAILLSLALADRINILKKEKAESQAKALEVSKENERIVKEQNLILENKVKERTADLENSNHQLTHTLDELKATQSQLVDAEKMASLGQLTAGVAHEINNPINFVSANIQPLRYDVQDILSIINMYDGISNKEDFESSKKEIEKFKQEIDIDYVKTEIEQLLNGIQDGASRTAEIVKSLKNFSRIDESSLKYINLNEGLESTLVILSSSIPTDIRIIKDLGDIPQVECFGGKINQVFMNILTNSIQALETLPDKPDRFLEIKSWREEDFVYFRFKDNGPGMSQEVRNKIFEPFFTTKDVGEGTGLGLSITFGIIETHKGKISVESELGIGATFTVKLPIEARIEHLN